jgi:hypothetical protein
MEQYCYKRKADGQYIINLKKLWEKLLFAARAIAAIENPGEDRYTLTYGLSFPLNATTIGVRQGVALDSLKFHSGSLCPTLLCFAGRPPLK